MEKLEATFQRMIDMQKQGSDIYYGGFSQMKRFPFFYDISNWLVPFYLQHPDVSQQVKQLAGNKFIEKIIATGPFCNSDKYSFLIAFQQVMDRLPESMREMLRRGEATLAGGLGNEEELQSPAYIRRLYLMDLYRFFRLFSHRSELLNPFDRDGLCPCFFFHLNLFCGTPLDAHKRDIVRLLKKHRYTDEADRLLATFPASMHDVQYFLWTGDYDKVLEQDPTNERALRSRVRRLYQDGRYEEALVGYDQLMQQHPDKVLYQLNVAVCLLSLKRYEEALKLLYRLNYEQPDDVGVSRVLAWTLTSAGRLEQAEKAYQQLTAGEQSDQEDQTNYGYCLWLQGRIDEAAERLKGCADLDEEWLSEHGISAVEIKMMRTLANR
jgi:tetratricopeptide (TPR) repeat protein